MTNPLDTLLAPFKDLDIASSYQSHHLAIDFCIYLTLFLGLSQFVFAKRFPGKAGKSISIGIALAMSTGMTVFSAMSGFSLSRFGPVAAGILIVLVGLLFYSLIKQLGGNSVNAGLAGFILTYFVMRAVSPELYQWMQSSPYASWIDAALLLSIPVLLVLLVLRVKPQFKLPSLDKIKNPVAEADKQQSETDLKNQEKADVEAITEERKAAKSEKIIAKDLDALISLLTQRELTSETVQQIKGIVQDLQQQESQLDRTLNQIRIINDKLDKWEITSLQKLNHTFQQLSPPEQEAFKRAILQERQAILKHKSVEELQQRAAQLRTNYRQFLSRAINELSHTNKRSAIYFLRQARQQEQLSKADRTKAEELLKQLLRLTDKAAKRVRRLAA